MQSTAGLFNFSLFLWSLFELLHLPLCNSQFTADFDRLWYFFQPLTNLFLKLKITLSRPI